MQFTTRQIKRQILFAGGRFKISVSAGEFVPQDIFRKKAFPPECNKPFAIKIFWMQRPDPHERII